MDTSHPPSICHPNCQQTEYNKKNSCYTVILIFFFSFNGMAARHFLTQSNWTSFMHLFSQRKKNLIGGFMYPVCSGVVALEVVLEVTELTTLGVI